MLIARLFELAVHFLYMEVLDVYVYQPVGEKLYIVFNGDMTVVCISISRFFRLKLYLMSGCASHLSQDPRLRTLTSRPAFPTLLSTTTPTISPSNSVEAQRAYGIASIGKAVKIARHG